MFRIIVLCTLLRSSLAIVGGGVIDITKAPFQAFLFTDGGNVCAGAIVGAGTVITVAACFTTRTVTFVNVRMGSNSKDEGGRVVQGKGYVLHPKYNKANHNFDIALLYLNEVLTFGPTIQPIPVSSDRLCAGSEVEAFGWGGTAEGAPWSHELRSVKFEISPTSLCKQVYGSILGDGMFCAGTMAGGRGTCSGDGGGPVVMNGKLVGMTSQLIGCARPAVPTIYSHIPAAYDWIVQNIK